MAVQNYTGWATGVNRIILDSTSFTFGENALKNDELENGLKRSKKRSAFCPDKFSVKMAFNWVDEVILHTYDAQGNILTDIPTGKTEFQLFTEWYKYQHKYGSVPFEFPRILYSQNTCTAPQNNREQLCRSHQAEISDKTCSDLPYLCADSSRTH